MLNTRVWGAVFLAAICASVLSNLITYFVTKRLDKRYA